MRIVQLSNRDAGRLIQTALDQGVNMFDHADIYGKGESEIRFSEAIQMNESIREKMILQSKCGIRPGFYDSSKAHILASVDGILQRLKTSCLDILLLHRPDALIEPEEVAAAFDQLSSAGKVKYFGVSNYNPMQIELLQRYVSQKLIVNQLQLSVVHTPVIDSGMAVNMHIDQAVNREGSILDYCRLHHLTVQAWSPFQKGFIEGPFFEDKKYAVLTEKIDRIAAEYGVTRTTVAVAWITRHPANIQVILGTTNPQRLTEGCSGSELQLTREQWYEIYKSAGNMIP
jgi:predicted oxidoreductase